MATLDDVINRVAGLLNIKGAGQTLSAEDADVIRQVARSVIDELSLSDIMSFPDEDDIPAEALIALAQRITVDCATDFGTTLEALAASGVTKIGSENRLRRISQDTEADNFIVPMAAF